MIWLLFCCCFATSGMALARVLPFNADKKELEREFREGLFFPLRYLWVFELDVSWEPSLEGTQVRVCSMQMFRLEAKENSPN
jgi:hypothetical protein